MASTIKPMNDCYLIQGTLRNPVTIPAGQIASVFSSQDLSTVFSSIDVGTLPTGRKLIGAVFLWGSGSAYYSSDLLVQNGLITMRLWNYTANQMTLTSVRLLTFWE